MSIGNKGSSTTTCGTCASETDDGDYETSSEGQFVFVKEKPISDNPSKGRTPRASSTKIDSECSDQTGNPNSEVEKISEEISQDRKVTLVKSESMPLLKKVSSNEEDVDELQVAQTSESSLARQRKIKVIVAKMAPLLSQWSNPSLTTTSNTSKTDLNDGNYQAKKLESKTQLPVLQDVMNALRTSSREVTSREVLDDSQSAKISESSERGGHGSPNSGVNTTEKHRDSPSDDDLINIAQNPHPSIKSFYFPPNPMEKDGPSTDLRIQPRITKNRDALLRIDGELGPLQHKLNEITGKFRAMNLTAPSLLSQGHYSTRGTLSSNTSGYHLHRTETFGRDSNANHVVHGSWLPSRQGASNPLWETRVTDNLNGHLLCPLDNESVPFSHNLYPVKETISNGQESFLSARSTSRNMSNSNWLIDEKNSFASMKNSYLQFEDPVNRDPSGSLIPCVSSSYYKCHRHKQSDYQRPGCYIESVGRSGSNLMKQRGSALSTDSSSNKQLEPMNFVSSRHPDNVRSKKHIYQTPSAGSDDSGRVSKCSDQEYRKKVALDNRSDALCIPSTSKAPQMHVVSVNTTVQQQYTGRIVADVNSGHQEASNPKQILTDGAELFKNDGSCSHHPQNVSSSVMVIGSTESNKTRYVNYTRVNSQTSLIITKKDQSAETTGLERTENVMTSAHLIMRNQGSSNEMKKKLRDLDIQCSGFNLRYHQKEVFFRPSVESLLRPSGSEESSVSKSNSDQTRGVGVSKADEKILVVPVFFTDGVPEAPNIPFFKFTKSRHSFPKSSHHVVRVQKKTPSFTHSCLLSDTSAESLEMEDYLRQRLVNKEHWNSGISLSVSRNPSLTCSKHHSRVSTAVSKQTHKCHLIGKHKSPGSMVSDSIRDSRHCFGLTKKGAKRVMPGLRCSPEDFFCDT